MMKWSVLLSFVLAIVLGCAPAWAEKRVALVIGNSEYRTVPRLTNPRNDAADMRVKLDELGFQIFGGSDLDRQAMLVALTGFGRAAENADVALVFYAGHGLQVKGENYLVPIDANVEYEAELNIALVPLSIVMQQLQRGSRINIALLDACRDNPFQSNLTRSLGTRAVGTLGRGLSRVPSAQGTFIAYATEPDNVAQDGDGRNSPFTSALLAHMDKPLSISDMMIEVRNQVIKSTNGKQIPWDTSSLTGRFSFKIEGSVTIGRTPDGAGQGALLLAPGDMRAVEARVWDAIKGSNDPEAFRKYLEDFPNGVFTMPARERIAVLTTRPSIEALRTAAEECDRLAAASGDPGLAAGAPGIALAAIRNPEAIRACERAVQENAANGRLKFQLGRAYAADKQFGEAFRLYREAADSGHAGGMSNLGALYSTGRGVTRDPAEAVRFYRMAAEAGNATAMRNLAIMHASGSGIAQDYQEANRWYRKAADAGNAAAMGDLGISFETARGVPRDFTEALRWYRKAAEAGEPAGMRNLANMFINGNGVAQDFSEANRWYRKAADAGNADAMTNLGFNLENGRGIQQDLAEAVRWYRKGADAGAPTAMKNLGVMYDNGRGVTQDIVEANRWYRKAADAGNADAMTNLGFNLENGRGIQQDLAEAVRWYRKGADAGAPTAMKNLGVMYDNGRGVAKDFAEANRWYRKAMEAGDVAAATNLGYNYENGRGVKKSTPEAVKLYRQAAEGGDVTGMVNIALLLTTGRGVPANQVEARKWFARAAELGNEEAKKQLSRMRR